MAKRPAKIMKKHKQEGAADAHRSSANGVNRHIRVDSRYPRQTAFFSGFIRPLSVSICVPLWLALLFCCGPRLRRVLSGSNFWEGQRVHFLYGDIR
jgi:hypothetical protein